MMRLKYVALACLFLVPLGCFASDDAARGFLEGHLRILPFREVELSDGTPAPATAEMYAEFPLIILSQREKKEVARTTADANGNYHLALPPGNYVLDVRGRAPGHVRARPQRFTVVSKETVRVDMDIDTGVR
jgi:Carboxypeptidase regulatory-like domain